MAEQSAFELAQELMESEHVHDVRVSSDQMVVAFAPEDRFVEKISEKCHDHIMSVISDTTWQTEYEEPGRNAERHSWCGGRSRPIMPSTKHPAGYELQYRLVQ